MAGKGELRPGSRLRVLYDYAGEADGYLTIRAGEMLTIASRSDADGWLMAKNQRGDQGYIPANYVEVVAATQPPARTSLTPPAVPTPWLHGKVSREDVIDLMYSREEGLFLIRKSSHGQEHALSLVHQGQIRHYLIYKRDQGFTINETDCFETLSEFVEHYKREQGDLATRLRKHVPKQ